MLIAPFNPVCDYRALPTKSAHEGNYFDPVTGNYATVTRTTPKAVYDAETGLIHDVAAGYLAVRPYSNSRAGGAGCEAIIEPERTNAYLDSYFAAADITAAWASDGTLTRSTDVPAVYGTHVAKVVLTGGAGDSNATRLLISQERPYSAAQTVTTSAWARGSATGLTVQRFIEALDSGGGVLGTVTANITLGAGWERGTLTYTNLPTGTVKTRSGIRATAVDTGDTVTLYVDAAQSEVGAFATSYIPTTTAAATRNADVVRMPTAGWNAAAGTWVTVVGPSPGHADTRGIFSWYGSSSNRMRMYYGTGAYALAGMSIGGGDTNYDTKAFSGAAIVGAMVCNAGDPVRVYVDGLPGTRTDAHVTPTGLPATAEIGQLESSAYLGTSIQRVTVYAEALTDAQIADLNPLIAGVLPHDPP